MNEFFDSVRKEQEKTGSLVCGGIDIDPTKEGFPSCLRKKYTCHGNYNLRGAFLDFGIHILRAIDPYVCVYKINKGFVDAIGAEKELHTLIEFAHGNGKKVILDAKYSDIDNSAKMYAKAAFERFNADAVTLNPYMGVDSIEPFLDYSDKGVFVLCLTSNKGHKDFQMNQVVRTPINAGTIPLFQDVAEKAKRWGRGGNLGFVIGATADEKDFRRAMDATGDCAVLSPGLGAQGGNLEMVAKSRGKKLILVNASRSIIYASSGDDFVEQSTVAACNLKHSLNDD
jgi:orotidine-5'-phosphate decarboxylase